MMSEGQSLHSTERYVRRPAAPSGHAPAFSARATGQVGVKNVTPEPPAGKSRGEPIWVDDIVLGLVNSAADAAMASGAREVDLSHLIHVMTHTQPTIQVLRELNIHVPGLKRETYAIITAGPSAGKSKVEKSPPHSKELEDVLTQAADRAYARRSLVTVVDIITTLLAMNQDHPTRKLLHRHRSDFELHDPADNVGADIPRRSEVDDARQKVRVSARSNYIGESHHIPMGVPTVTDVVQNSRMDQLEQTLRVLTEEMERNQSTFASLVEGMRKEGDAAGQMPQSSQLYPNYPNGQWSRGSGDVNGGRLNGGEGELQYLLGRVENGINAKFAELARGWSVLGERLGDVEKTIDGLEFGDNSPLDITPELEARLKTISFSDDRLAKLETVLASLPLRLTEMERRLELLGSDDRSFDMERMLAKLDAVETLMRDNTNDGSFELTPVMSSLKDVEAGMRGLGGQLREVDSRTGDVNLLIDDMGERQKRLEELVEAQQDQIRDLVKIVREEVGNISIGQGNDAGISSSVNAVLSERLTGLTGQMQHRIGQLEDVVRNAMERPVVVNNAGEPADNSYLNDAVGKIINNQHTLAGSIDEWRGQVRDDLAAVSARMDAIDTRPVTTASLPEERFNEISERLKQLQQTIPARGQPVDGWSRFKLWLFGTDDWYRDSWGVREEDRGWVAPQATAPRHPNQATAYEAGYEQNGYDNRRV